MDMTPIQSTATLPRSPPQSTHRASRAQRTARALSASLQAKVQDADESEEALRLTLKAAAHAKEELLANATEQAKIMEDEAAARAGIPGRGCRGQGGRSRQYS